jgi:predicted HicB family RNase H-like nuclease
MKKTKPIRGGAREGAGRKRMGVELRKCLTVRITPSALDKLENLAKSQGVSKGVFIENLINEKYA